MTSGKLAGKACLVTGASRGFGRAIALTLAREGARVGVNYVESQAKAEAVVKEIHALGADAAAIRADVSKGADVKRLFEEHDRAFGRLDLLVNNAGFNKAAPFLEVKEEDFDKVVAVNFKGVFLCTQEAGRRMLAQGSGRIVNLASMAGLRARPGSAHYGAAKAAVVSLTKSAAEAFAPRVQVNAIAPGFFDTELNAYVTPERRAKITELIPMGRWGDPQEIADLVLQLATAPAYVTGSTIEISGGMQNNYIK